MNNWKSILLVALALITFGAVVAEEQQTVAVTAREVSELVKQLDSSVERRRFGHDFTTNDFEVVLPKLIKLGSSAEKPLELKLSQDAARRSEAEKEFDLSAANSEFNKEFELVEFPNLDWKAFCEIDRLSNNCELLTALRRIQKKSDPLSIQVIQPIDVKAIPGKLPTFSVKLKSVDVEKTSVWAQLIPHFHGSRREAQWRFEVKTAAGTILPIRPDTSRVRFGGGIKSDGWLKYGDYLDTILPMGAFIDIAEPGEYTVTLMYHPKLPIADVVDIAELDDLIVFRSESFKLTVHQGPKIVIKSTQAIRGNVLSLITELPNEGVVKVVGGVYDEDDFAFLPPDSPPGRILTLNWQAVPSLLDSLSDARLSRHRKAWVLSLLYSITAEHDLNPIFSGGLPEHEGMAGKNTFGAVLSGEGGIIARNQDQFIAKWQKYRDTDLDIRESDDE